MTHAPGGDTQTPSRGNSGRVWFWESSLRHHERSPLQGAGGLDTHSVPQQSHTMQLGLLPSTAPSTAPRLSAIPQLGWGLCPLPKPACLFCTPWPRPRGLRHHLPASLHPEAHEPERHRLSCVNKHDPSLRSPRPGAQAKRQLTKVETLGTAIGYTWHLRVLHFAPEGPHPSTPVTRSRLKLA